MQNFNFFYIAVVLEKDDTVAKAAESSHSDKTNFNNNLMSQKQLNLLKSCDQKMTDSLRRNVGNAIKRHWSAEQVSFTDEKLGNNCEFQSKNSINYRFLTVDPSIGAEADRKTHSIKSESEERACPKDFDIYEKNVETASTGSHVEKSWPPKNSCAENSIHYERCTLTNIQSARNVREKYMNKNYLYLAHARDFSSNAQSKLYRAVHHNSLSSYFFIENRNSSKTGKKVALETQNFAEQSYSNDSKSNLKRQRLNVLSSTCSSWKSQPFDETVNLRADIVNRCRSNLQKIKSSLSQEQYGNTISSQKLANAECQNHKTIPAMLEFPVEVSISKQNDETSLPMRLQSRGCGEMNQFVHVNDAGRKYVLVKGPSKPEITKEIIGDNLSRLAKQNLDTETNVQTEMKRITELAENTTKINDKTKNKNCDFVKNLSSTKRKLSSQKNFKIKTPSVDCTTTQKGSSIKKKYFATQSQPPTLHQTPVLFITHARDSELTKIKQPNGENHLTARGRPKSIQHMDIKSIDYAISVLQKEREKRKERIKKEQNIKTEKRNLRKTAKQTKSNQHTRIILNCLKQTNSKTQLTEAPRKPPENQTNRNKKSGKTKKTKSNKKIVKADQQVISLTKTKECFSQCNTLIKTPLALPMKDKNRRGTRRIVGLKKGQKQAKPRGKCLKKATNSLSVCKDFQDILSSAEELYTRLHSLSLLLDKR